MAKKQTLAQLMRDEANYTEVQGHRKDGMDRLLDWLLEVDEKNGKRDTTTVTYDSDRADKMLLYNKARWEEKYKDIPFPVEVKEDLKNEIIDNFKFEEIIQNNLVLQPWLLNHDLGKAAVPISNPDTEETSEEQATVYTRTYETGDNQFTVVPTIMENENGQLQYYEDPDEAFNRGYGISFETEKEANDFAMQLHQWHKISSETQTSYDPK